MQTSNSLLTRWISKPWFFTLWSVLAAIGTYACMYGFRKPFTTGTYEGGEWGLAFKTVLVTAQVFGYMLSKFIGIKVISEMTAKRRAATLLGLIALAEIALLLFAVTPVPYRAGWLFVNGLALGMVFGLVLGFVEGRCMTELFVAGLCISFIVADGFTKSVGAMLLANGISERWMPGVAGLLFALPLLIFVWMLRQIPPPSAQDIAARSQRTPMTSGERHAMLRRHGAGLMGIVLVYLLVTIMRSLRADFAPEIWKGLGLAAPPAIFTQSEMLVAIIVGLACGALVLIKDNRRAMLTGLGLSAGGLFFALLVLAQQRAGALSPFAFMVLFGVGIYLPYVAIHTTIFERLIALTRERGNMGYLMYIADAVGYLGYVGVMMVRGSKPSTANFLPFFAQFAAALLGVALLAMLVAWIFFARRFQKVPVAPRLEPLLESI